MWPGCKLVRGTPRHSESNGGVERRNRTTETRLGAMMEEYQSNRWSVLCKLVQWQMNASHHKAINGIPYHSFTGQLPAVGLSNLPLDANIMDRLFTEASLVEAFGGTGDQLITDLVYVPPSERQVDKEMSEREMAQHHLTTTENEVSRLRAQLLNATMLEVQLRKAEADMEAAKVAFEASGTCDSRITILEY